MRAISRRYGRQDVAGNTDLAKLFLPFLRQKAWPPDSAARLFLFGATGQLSLGASTLRSSRQTAWTLRILMLTCSEYSIEAAPLRMP